MLFKKRGLYLSGVSEKDVTPNLPKMISDTFLVLHLVLEVNTFEQLANDLLVTVPAINQP